MSSTAPQCVHSLPPRKETLLLHGEKEVDRKRPEGEKTCLKEARSPSRHHNSSVPAGETTASLRLTQMGAAKCHLISRAHVVPQYLLPEQL